MPLVTNYETLKAHIADTLNRLDLTSVIPNFIQQFESRAKDDFRLRRLTNRGDFSVSTDLVRLPPDLYSLEAWYHDGPVYFGPIEIVSPDQIGLLKAKYGATGVPQYAAIVAERARFAPVPDATYSTKMAYWQTLTPLSDSASTNWLLESRPDIYLYGTLIEAHNYLKDPEKEARDEARLQNLIEAHYLASVDNQFGGTMGRRNVTPIGG